MVEVGLSTVRHLGFGLRALAFLRVDPARLKAIGPEPVIIVILYLGCHSAYSALLMDHLSLSAWGVSSTVAYAGVMLAGLAIIGTRQRGLDVTSLVSVLLATWIWTGIVTVLGELAWNWIRPGSGSADDLDRVQSAAAWTWFIWYVAALWLFGWRATSVRPARFGLGLVVAAYTTLLLPWSPVVVGSQERVQGLLQTAFDTLRPKRQRSSGETLENPIDVEAAYMRQADLIDAQLDGLAPSQPGKGQIYFVGMATYSEQDVFKREIISAREIVDARFETRGRSVLMINHRDTVETLPLANATNLERVLWRIAQRMDHEHDALVLYITTHGSEGHLSVTFPGFSMNDLTPEKLSGILERTGIRNKVVILSACHAGSFLPALSGPDTLVMAAARADRSSFGCSNERDWTYFGDALFNHALRETHSFRDAFERAKTLVGQWESDQKLSPPSEPQIAIGERIAGKLDALARGLDGVTVARPVSD